MNKRLPLSWGYLVRIAEWADYIAKFSTRSDSEKVTKKLIKLLEKELKKKTGKNIKIEFLGNGWRTIIPGYKDVFGHNWEEWNDLYNAVTGIYAILKSGTPYDYSEYISSYLKLRRKYAEMWDSKIEDEIKSKLVG